MSSPLVAHPVRTAYTSVCPEQEPASPSRLMPDVCREPQRRAVWGMASSVAILRMWWWTTPLQLKAAAPGRVAAGCVWPSRAPSICSREGRSLRPPGSRRPVLHPGRARSTARRPTRARAPAPAPRRPEARLSCRSRLSLWRDFLHTGYGRSPPTLTRCARAGAALRRTVFSGACSDRSPRCAGTTPSLNTRSNP
jgi:hypothetical protein